MLLILTAWIVWIPLAAGIGAAVMRWFGKHWQSVTDLFLFFWVGTACILVFLILWNFFLPVTLWTLALVTAAGMAGWIVTARDAWSILRARLPEAWLVLAIWLALGVLIANQAMLPIDTNDTGEYHLPLVAWASTYPVVPGLGNLSTRFANNQSYFLLAALVDEGPFRGNSHQLLNGLFLFAALGQCLAGFYRLLPGRGVWKAEHFLAALLIAPILDDVNQKGFISLTPDFAIFAVGIAVALLLIRIIRERDEPHRAVLTGALVLIASAGVTIKLSFAVFAAGACLLALAFVLLDKTIGSIERRRLILFSIVTVAVIGFIWMLRGVILSGYPAFPSTIGALPVDWKMPAETVQAEADWVILRARNPEIAAEKIITGPGWVSQWLTIIPVTFPRQFEFLYAIVVIAAVFFRPARWKELGPLALFLLIPLAATIFWFLTAPGPRFIGSSLWILTTGFALLVLLELDLVGKPMPVPAILAGLFFLWVVSFASMPKQFSLSRLILPPDRSALPAVNTVTLADGAQVFTPVDAGGCMNTPLPCTSNIGSGLVLREAGNLAGGFRLQPTTQP